MFGLTAVCVVLLAYPPRRRVSEAVRLLLVFVALALAIGARHFTDALAGAAVGAALAYFRTIGTGEARATPAT